MKIIFKKNNNPVKKDRRAGNPGNPNLLEQRDPYKVGIHEFYNFILAKKGIKVRDCYDRPKFESNLKKERLENPEKTYEFEYVYKYDWLTEYDNLQRLLSNPYKVSGRYKTLGYDEIKRKGFLIVSRQLSPGQKNVRLFKGQRVLYFLYSKKRQFPKNAMVVTQKPNEVTIRYDTFRNKIRLEGPNSHYTWQNFTI